MFFRKQTQNTRTILVDGALVKHTFSEKAYRYSLRISLGIFLLGLVLLVIPFVQHANTRTFYPSVCLGDWKYPEEATGEPGGIGHDGSGAAILEESGADIFCSSFVGSPPSEEKITRARLTFSWHIGELPEIEEDDETTEHATEEPEENITEESAEEPTEETAQSEEPAEEPAEETPAENPEETPEVPADALGDTPPQESAFLEKVFSFVARAYAQETELPAETEDTVTEPVTDEVPDEPVPEEPQMPDGTPSEEIEVPEEPVSEEDSSEVVLPADEISDAQIVVRVSYTLDGSTWAELGDVSLESWEETEFELPILAWSDIENLQILVQGEEGGETVSVYLDAVKLAVLYERPDMLNPEEWFISEEEMGEIAIPYIPPDVPEYVPEDRIFDREIIVDPLAVHTCRAETFPVDITEETSTTTHLLLTTSSSTREQLEIGSVPKGINVTFGGDRDYTLRPKGGDPVPVVITKEEDSQTGSFTVPVMYTAFGKKDSIVICQIGITNQ